MRRRQQWQPKSTSAYREVSGHLGRVQWDRQTVGRALEGATPSVVLLPKSAHSWP